MNKFYHPYHMVTLSPWPLLLSFSLMIMMIGMLKWFNLKIFSLLIYGYFLVLLVMFQWWRDIIRESIYFGVHSMYVLIGMKYGMFMFIVSELMFFISFFWAYFHSFLSPSVEIGMIWHPKSIWSFDAYGIPLFNTMVLLTSGMVVTWSHSFLYKNKKNKGLLSLMFTILLGVLFSIMQLDEYIDSFFCINDSVYGALFFVLTGFHGLHVLFGSFFIMVIFFRMMVSEMGFCHHIGYEFCTWYWHFVDIIWLGLYILLYCLF